MLGLAAQLHDVGKIGLPDSILLKPGRLTPEEFDVVKRHCDIGSRIVRPSMEETMAGVQSNPKGVLEVAAKIALTHHEHWNGAGYPRGLAGKAIPIEGRIVAVADVFDALSSARSYKPAMTSDQVLLTMGVGRGPHFDPVVLDALLRRMPDILKVPAENKATPTEPRPGASFKRIEALVHV